MRKTLFIHLSFTVFVATKSLSGSWSPQKHNMVTKCQYWASKVDLDAGFGSTNKDLIKTKTKITGLDVMEMMA